MKVIAQSTVSSKLPYLHLAYTAATTRTPQGSIFTLAFLMLIIGLVLTFKTSKRKTKRGFTSIHIVFRKMAIKKRIYRILLLIFAASLIFLSFFYGTERYHNPTIMARFRVMSIGHDLIEYKDSNEGKFPKIFKWCDELLESGGKTIGVFQHPGLGPGRNNKTEEKISDYAINANLASLDSNEEIPPDVVVLFEAKEGWNQAGGAELINTDLGDKSGCFVLLGDGKAKFVKKEEINKLRWDIE